MNNAEISRNEDVQDPAKSGNEAEKAARITLDKTIAKPLETPPETPYYEVLMFPETGKISSFISRNYNILKPIRLNSSRLRPITFVFYTSTGTTLLRKSVLHHS